MLSFFNFLAGIALMLLGIRSLRTGSDRVFGAKFRELLRGATQGRVRAVLAGFLVSILAPSSTAVALLAVEAVNAGYVALQQMLALMLGANIGFTITVQLLAFKFYIYNSVFIAVGASLYLFSHRQTARGAGQALLGIGFLLLAIEMLSLAVAPWKDSAEIREMLRVLENHPLGLMAFALALQVGLQSSTTVIGIAIALCAQQVLPLDAAVVMVLGANIGIAVTALIAGYARTETRRMAIGNLLFKLAGVAICLPLLPWLIRVLQPLSPSGDTQLVANAHTLFNVALALAFLPLVPAVAPLLEKLVPARAEATGEFGPRYLDESSLESPALALGQATREILRMADIVREMLRNVHRCFQEGNETLCEEVRKEDDKVDLLNNAIKAYITRLSEQALNTAESRREIALLTFATELENIGDIIDKNLVELAEKKITLHVDFSTEGRVELEGYFQKVLENFEIAISAFASQDKVLAVQLLRHKHHINELERDLRNRHFHRLHEGLKESFETSAVHLDVLTNLKAINSHLTAVAYPIIENGLG
ncbi:MAG TPA: Na/Pi cotransporter family protein [Verrucomicrobiae bacterium]|nr:Na/Pi cotransporter family protein [Verrucomicrobiae bacterium]